MAKTTRGYIEREMAAAKELGNSSFTLFAKDEEDLIQNLNKMGLEYCSPRVGQYFVFI